MSTLTFDHVHSAPRRHVARKPVRKPVQAPVVALEAPALHDTRRRTPASALVLVGAIVGLHAFAIVALSGKQPAAAPVAIAQPITIALAVPKVAPPPPPPPKPEPAAPRAKAVAPAPTRVASTPVVADNTPLVQASADTVQVAQASTPVREEAAPPAPVPEEPVTEPRGYAGYLRNPAPDYPPAAQKRGLEGKVVLKVHVLASGQPDSVSVARSSGHQILDDAALKAVLQWAFAPARRGQTAIDGWVQVPLSFKI